MTERSKLSDVRHMDYFDCYITFRHVLQIHTQILKQTLRLIYSMAWVAKSRAQQRDSQIIVQLAFDCCR